MAEYLTNTEDMKIVADAIRAKGGTSAPLEFPQGMAQAIADIPTGGGKPEQEYIDDFCTNNWPTGDITIKAETVATSAFRNRRKVNSVVFTAPCTLSGSCFEHASITTVDARTVIDLGTNSQNIFRECNNLTRVVFRDLKEKTAYFTFYKSTNLKYVDWGEMESKIRLGDFEGCSALETVILRYAGVVWLDNKSDFSGSGVANGTGYVYVPKALVKQYKEATNWVAFADQIRAIEDYPEITGG